MSMSMNIHGVERIELGEILCHQIEGRDDFYTRGIIFFDGEGNKLLTIDPFATNGHNLLVDDAILADMKLPFELKAA